MGHILHHAIVVTSWSDVAIEAAAIAAREAGCRVIGPSEAAINGYRSILVCPDGSKSGWADSDDGDGCRDQFISYLRSCRYKDGSSSMEWVEVAYGGDDRTAEVSRHEWDDRASSLEHGTGKAFGGQVPHPKVGPFVDELGARRAYYDDARGDVDRLAADVWADGSWHVYVDGYDGLLASGESGGEAAALDALRERGAER